MLQLYVSLRFEVTFRPRGATAQCFIIATSGQGTVNFLAWTLIVLI